MNSSLRTGKIELDWKKARLTALFKSGDSEDAPNYRTFSILPICMTLYECDVHSQLYDDIQENNLLCLNQSGFRQCHSTCTALTDVTESILSHLDNGY